MDMTVKKASPFIDVDVPSCLGPVSLKYQNQFTMGFILS